MRIYSAGESIGPAWEHTKALLWPSRNPKRFLKICLVAIGAEIGGLHANFGSLGNHGNAKLPPQVAATLVAFSIVFGVVFLMVGLVLFYLSSRLQVVLFDLVLLREDRVAPAWKRHGAQTWRWIGVKLTAMVAIAIALSPLLLPAITAFVALMHSMTSTANAGGTPHFTLPAVRTMLLLIGEMLLAFFVYVAVFRFFTNLALPGLALEDLRYGATFQRAWELFRSDVAGMLLFAVVQPLFLMVLGFAGVFCIVLAMLLAAVPLAGVGGVLWLLLHKAGSAVWAVLGLWGVVSALVLLAWFLLCEIAVLGSLYTFSRAWSMYFLGGRYAMVGQYLEPSVAVPVWTPPPSLPRDEDGDDGPDFPVSPVLA